MANNLCASLDTHEATLVFCNQTYPFEARDWVKPLQKI